MSEWCERIAQAKASGKNIPEAQLFRRMLWHEFWRAPGGGGGGDVFCEVELLPPGEEAPEPLSGLQLAGTVGAKEDVGALAPVEEQPRRRATHRQCVRSK